MDGFSILCWINCVSCTICAVIIAIAVYQYGKNVKHIAMQKRYAKITIGEAIVCKLKYASDAFSFAFILWQGIDVAMGINPVYTSMIELTNTLVTASCCLWIWRFWMLRYDVLFEIDMMNDKWKSILNSNEFNTNSWYIDNKKTYGDSKWIVKKYILPLFIITAIIQAFEVWLHYLGPYKNNPNSWPWVIYDAQGIASSIIMSVLLIVIYCKMPHFEDNLFIMYELKWIIFWFATSQIVWAVGNTGAYITFPGSDVIEFGLAVCNYFIYISTIFVSTYTVNKRLTIIIQESRFTHKRIVDNLVWLSTKKQNKDQFAEPILYNASLNSVTSKMKTGKSLSHSWSIINSHPSKDCLS